MSTEFRLDFFGALRSHSEARPEDPAMSVAGGEGAWSWARLTGEIRSLSGYLAAWGIQPGDRVAILMENHPRWGIAFVAVQSVGAIAVPVDTLISAASAAAIVEHSQATFLIASPQTSAVASQIPVAGMLANEEQWNAATSGDGRLPLPLVRGTLEDPLALLYTGGTTGKPKGVLLTKRNLYRSITDMLEIFPLSPSDRILSVLPLFHIMPLLANLIAPLYTGASVVFLSQLDSAALMNAFATEGITAFLCVPQFYYQIERRIREEVARQSAGKRMAFGALLKVSGWLRRNFGRRAGRLFFGAVHARFGTRLRALGIGGAWFNPKSAEYFADLGFTLFQAYGLTECGGLATATPLDRNGGLSCGPAVAHCELRVVNPNPAGIGEIAIRGENVMQGYWRDPDATAEAIREGWLYTGDLGTMDAEGNLRLTGRAKDVIVLSSGKNIFPEELEEYFLKLCPSLQEICFVGREGSDGSALHCVAVPKAEGEEEQVRREVAGAARELPSYKRPRSLTVTRSPLPRTSTRKLQRFRIREQAGMEAQETAAVAAAEPLSLPNERELAALIQRVRPGARPGAATHLEFDLHLDSLERVELIANVEKAFGISIDDTAASGIHTFGDLLSAVGGAPSGASPHGPWSVGTDLIRQPLTPEERNYAGRYLRRRPVAEALWYGAGRGIWLTFRLGLRLKVRRAAAFPRGPFLLCPNHLSFLDDPVIACSLPWPVFRRMFAVAAGKYFRGRLATWLISLLRVLPIDEDRNLLNGLRMAKAGLEKGLVLCIFPEGTRSGDGRLQELKKGAALLACALKLPVVPVGLDGTFEAWPRNRSLPRTHPVAISYGAAISPLEGESADSFQLRLVEALADEVRNAKDYQRRIS